MKTPWEDLAALCGPLGRFRPVPFLMSHLAGLRPAREEALVLLRSRAFLWRLELYRQLGPAMSVLDEGNRVRMVAGIAQLWPGVGEAWMLADEGAAPAARAGLRLLRGLGEHFALRMRLRRLQAAVRADDEAALRWAFRAGLRPEARLAKYGPRGEDCWMLARTWEDR